MRIRRLYLTDQDDFASELKFAGLSDIDQCLQNYLPTHFIFKLSDITTEKYHEMLHRFDECKLPYWTDKSRTPHFLLVAFSDWGVLDRLPEDEITAELMSLKNRCFIDRW